MAKNNHNKQFLKRYGVGMALAAAGLATLGAQAYRNNKERIKLTARRLGKKMHAAAEQAKSSAKETAKTARATARTARKGSRKTARATRKR